MATPSTMILRALRLIGEKQVGDTLATAEQTAYLTDLNTMLESWSIDRLMVYQILQENFSLTSGTASYTIGSGGTFNTTWPTRITQAFVRDSSSYDFPVEVISQQSYDAIVDKTSGNTYPEFLFYDGAYVAGLGTIRLYPKPSASLTLYIDSWKQLQSFALISTTLVLPPGYQRAIEFNFAVEVAGGFTKVSDEVAKIARDSKAAIQRLNAPTVIARLPAGVAGRSRSSILTG